MRHNEFKNMVVSLKRTAYTVLVALFFVGGVSYIQAAFTYPSVNPPSNVRAPITLSSTFQDKLGGIQASKIGVANGIVLNGVTRTVADGWPTSDTMASCHLESRRVDTTSRRFYSNSGTMVNAGQYHACDEYLTPEARADGWVHSGGDECTTVISSDCGGASGVPSSCVYTRMVCANSLTMGQPMTSTSTYTTFPMTVPTPQCTDGVSNESMFVKAPDPATPPASWAQGTAFSPDGLYLAVPHETTPFISIYKRPSTSSDVFTKIANPATLPVGNAYAAAFSPDGLYLAVMHATTPFISIYKRPSTSSDVFTKIANPATLPAGAGAGVTFSPDGLYLALAHGTTPFVTIYSRPSITSDVFTKIANPATLPAGAGNDVTFSPDGLYLAVGHTTTPFISIYSRPSVSSSVFTKIANPATLPTGDGQGVSFSPDGLYLAVSHYVSPFISIYSRPSVSSNVFTKIANPATLPTGSGSKIDFSPDGLYLAMTHNVSPFVTIYNRPSVSSGVFTKMANPEVLPTGTTGSGVTYSPDGKILAVGHAGPGSVTHIKIYSALLYDTSIDYPNDPECDSWYDLTESSVEICSDGLDNDSDGNADYPGDSGCVSPNDSTE